MKIQLLDPWSNSPLGRWAGNHPTRCGKPMGYAVRALSHRYGLSPARAALVAELAGFVVEAR